MTDRTILPIPDRVYDGPVYEDAKDPRVRFDPIEPLRPPAGAPNVLIVLLDDVGFGASSAFGGPCRTPVAERLAQGGLSYSRFHTTALCAPTRQALLTGRNHHAVGMGAITEIATSAPGYTSVRPHSAAPMAQVLNMNGYATAQFGKCHEIPVWQTSPVGPFDAWPTGGGGFEHFFGFLGGETNQYAPALYDGTTAIEPALTAEEGYHFTEDMTDRAIAWVRQSSALTPDRPFFMYYAPGATHAPHHVPLDWADRYKGQFDDGWDALRERIFAEQKRLGVVPADAELTARHDEIPAWDDMPDDLKPVLARQMEVYAGFLEHTDFHVGRLIEALDEMGALSNTLVFYIIGDNGASAEGHINGSFNEYLFFNGAAALETPEFLRSRMDQLGTPEAYNHFSVGWAHAMDTPYQWTKQVASHWGGTRNGTIIHWPEGISAKGEVRDQFHHVIDVAPTVFEAAGIPAPEMVNGVPQMPVHGVSMGYSFNERSAADRHRTQYFEIGGNRGIYHEGWTAVTKHATPWIAMGELPAFADDVWELYSPDDWTQSRDLSEAMPDKLRELQELFLEEARRYSVLPLDDRRVERFNPAIAGRPHAHPRQLAAPLRRHGAAHRGHRAEPQERVARRGSGHRGPGRRRGRRDRRPGWRVRRVVALPATGCDPRVLLQPPGHAADEGRGRLAARTGPSSPRHDLRLRRWGTGDGRHRPPDRRRRRRRRGPARAHHPPRVLPGRDPRRGSRQRVRRQRRLHVGDE